MARIDWSNVAKYPQHGIDRGVLYFRPGQAVPWNGLIQIEENTEPPKLEPIYFDGDVINVKRIPSTFKARITAFTYPELLEDHLITKWDDSPYFSAGIRSQPVHLTYRVNTPNGKQIHMVYNCVFNLSATTTNTLGESPEVQPFVFDVVALPVSYGVNIYPHTGNRYDTPNLNLLPPPPGSDPSAYEDYYKNRYIEDQIPGLPPFIYPDLEYPNLEYPYFDDHLDLGNIFPTPHFVFDESLMDFDKWLSLEDMLYGNLDLSPTFGSPQTVFDLMLGPNPALGVDFGDGAVWDVGGVEFGLAANATTLGGTLANSYNYSTCLIPLEHGTALLHCQEQTSTSGVAAARLQMISYDGNGDIVTGDPLTLSMYWDLNGTPYEQWSKIPSYIGNGRVIMPMQTQLENGQPAGHRFMCNFNDLSITHEGAVGVDTNVGNNPWQVITDGQGSAILYNANDGNHWWIYPDGSQHGMVNAAPGTDLNNMFQVCYSKPSITTGENGVVVGVSSGSQLAKYTVDFANRTVSGPTYISPSGMNTLYDICYFDEGLTPGKVTASIPTSRPGFYRSICEEWYNKDLADLANSSDHADGIERATPASQDIFSFGGVATGLRGVVTLYQVYNGSSEYVEMSYYNPSSTYSEVLPISNTGTRRYMDIANVGNGYFIYLSATETTDALVELQAGWAR